MTDACYLCNNLNTGKNWERLNDGKLVHRMCLLNNYAYLKRLGLTKRDKSKQTKLRW